MLVDWGLVSREYDHDQGKELFQNILNNMEKEFVITFIQDFLSSISLQNFPLAKSLLLVKSLLSTAPKYAFISVTPSNVFQDWLLTTTVDIPQITSSLRCVGLVIIRIMTKNMRKDALQLERMGQAISCNILDALYNLSTFPSSNENFQLGRLLLHQCVDNLSFITDETSSWLHSIGDCIFNVCILLRIISTSPQPSFQGSGQFVVNLSKLFTRVTAIWFAQCQSSAHENKDGNDLISLFQSSPDNIFIIFYSQQSVIHESFQSAFYAALELAYRSSTICPPQSLGDDENNNSEGNGNVEMFTGAVAGRWVLRINHAIEDILTMCSTPKSTEEEFSKYFMDLGRLESLLLLLCSIFSLRNDLLKTRKGGQEVTKGKEGNDQVKDEKDLNHVQASLEFPWINAADLAISLIITTIHQLKSQITGIPPAKQKMFRPLASNVRKGGIALAEQVLISCPLYLRFPQSNRYERDEFITSFCLKTLSSPSLFSSIYRALTVPSHIIFVDLPTQPEECNRELIIQSILKHLSDGLKKISQYSMAAGIDLIATVEDLVTSNCLEIITHSEIDIPLLILQAYSHHPKISSSNEPSSEIPEWKSQCLACLLSIFDLSQSNPTTATPYTALFLQAFTERVPQDIILLHKCLGNTSPPPSHQTTNKVIETPSVRERNRKDAVAATATSFHTTNPEEFIPLLQNLVELQNKFLDSVLQFPSLQLTSQIGVNLLKLFTFLSEISLRPLLFEDDCTLLCSEIDLMAKFVTLSLDRSFQTKQDSEGGVGEGAGETGEVGEVLNPVIVRESFLKMVQDLDHCLAASDYISDQSQLKMIHDTCQLHLQRLSSSSSSSSAPLVPPPLPSSDSWIS